ncbi:hypothetical protein [Nocardioides mesophilus]|uniref:Uncharacterized protein n=1 Tax=Nocardioides mesophilus TaxID=433659 RepID=A0A7G9RHY7_9ACTN|nr:hypothetical protein [Nocardioides mesophilus]QNN55212.1 hypothetical protein H9L09_02635 [Nocardioides mesophilus]
MSPASPLSLVTTIVPGLSEVATSAPAVNPYLVGVGTFIVLLALMGALLAFGRGRDHS